MTKLMSVLMLALLFSPAPGFAEADEGSAEGNVRALSLDAIPELALKTAREAKPNVYFKSAERIWWHDEPVYRIMGTQTNMNWDVYVTGQGEVMRIDSDHR